MADVKSKNLYELLGNDPDEDSDQEPEPPTKAIDKPLSRSTKRNTPDVAPGGQSERNTSGGDRGGRGGHRGGFTGSEDAFRDRAAGSVNNRGKPTEDGLREDRHPDRLSAGRAQGNYEGRGGRGGRSGRGGRGNRDDRHTRGPPNDHPKQADQSWGAPTGAAEWDDEKAGEAIAKDEEKEGIDSTVNTPVDADGNHPEAVPEATDGAAPPPAQSAPEPEPEDNSKSYADYLAEQAEKKLKLGGGIPEARKANEGSKQDKKWAEAKPLSKDGEEDSYMAGKGEKAKRERQRKEKTRLDVDLRYVEPSSGSRGSDRGRGGRGRGEGRGDFRGGDRGRGGRGRGDGYRGRADGEYRGGYRGGRGGRGGDAVNVSDTSAFPSLGGP